MKLTIIKIQGQKNLNNAVYAKKSGSHLLDLYYLVLWKSYLKKKDTWELILAIQYLKKLIITFPKGYSEKPIATLSLINIGSLMAKPTAKFLAIKQKYIQLDKANDANKCAKKAESLNFYLGFGFISLRKKMIFNIIWFQNVYKTFIGLKSFFY